MWLCVCGLPWLWFEIRGTWPPLDVVAVGVPLLGVAGLLAFGLVSARTGRLLPLAAGLSMFAVASISVVLPRLPEEQPAPTQPIRIAAANVLGTNEQLDQAAEGLATRDVNMLVMVEARNGLVAAVQESSAYPYSFEKGQFGVLSDWPIEKLPLDGLGPAVLLEVQRPEGFFELLVVHAPNPLYETTFAEQEALATQLARIAQATELPTIVIGDLNLSDRVQGYRVMTESMRDAMRANTWPGDTYRLNVWRALLLRIDHLFVPNDWCAADPGTFDVPGSDHRGIEATIGPCPTGA